ISPMKIALISDTHGFIDEMAMAHLLDVDEIWHAGDIGSHSVLEAMPKGKRLRVVYGNIDEASLRMQFDEELFFIVEGLKVLMLHIGGKPPLYAKGVKNQIQTLKSDVFICGHAHICKVEYDKAMKCLYLNPGGLGMEGFHQVRTLLKFGSEAGKAKNLGGVEIPKKAKKNDQDA